jgi:hypothetical protein
VASGNAGKGNPNWVKGRSGNPGGRPKGVLDVMQACRQHTADAVATLVRIMQHGESDPARVAAANSLLDRGWGKPVQSHEVGGPGGGPVRQITRIEIVPVWPELTDETKTIEHDGGPSSASR